jgi:hypothetical protein
LKYNAFLLKDLNSTTKSVSVYFFCDSDSFAHYSSEKQAINGKTLSLKNMQHIQSFDLVLKSEDDYVCTMSELGILKQLASIQFIASSHCLSKGIGGKRAMIQYFHHARANDNINYQCMTIDDNITAIYEIHEGCTYKNTSKISISGCVAQSLLLVYDKLLHHASTSSTPVYYLGINKGKGTNDNSTTFIKVGTSCAIYKLNICFPVPIFKQHIYYNPYFTSFFEDVAFSSEINNYSLKLFKYHLNFGHFKALGPVDLCKQNKNDCDDFFSDYLKDVKYKPQIDGVMPVYIMYALYVKSLVSANNITCMLGNVPSNSGVDKHSLPEFLLFNKLKKPCSDNQITFPKGSKYAIYQYVLYLYTLIIYYSVHPIELCGQGVSDTLTQFIFAWMNKQLIQYNTHILSNGTREISYKFSFINDIPLKLLQTNNTQLSAIYGGTNQVTQINKSDLETLCYTIKHLEEGPTVLNAIYHENQNLLAPTVRHRQSTKKWSSPHKSVTRKTTMFKKTIGKKTITLKKKTLSSIPRLPQSKSSVSYKRSRSSLSSYSNYSDDTNQHKSKKQKK